MMKMKRVALLSLALFMVAGTAALAGSRWGTYEGYSKVQVNVNDQTMASGNVPAFVINGSTMLPLRETASSLNAIIKWDSSNQTANIYKPNVNMIVAQDLGFKKSTVDSVSRPFFKATKGTTTSFSVFIQVDSLLTAVDGFKLTLVDPAGNMVDSWEKAEAVNQDYLWCTWRFENINFAQSGNYSVQFAFKTDGGYTTVGEKLIVSE